MCVTHLCETFVRICDFAFCGIGIRVFRMDVIQKHVMLKWYAHCDGRLTDLHFCPHLQHTYT